MFWKKDRYYRLPSEFVRKPIYRRLPSWAREQVDGAKLGMNRLQATVLRFRLRVPSWVVMSALFVFGTAFGAFVMKQRQAGRDVVASVHTETVTAAELYHRLEVESGSRVLQAILNEKLTLQFARQRGALPAEREVQARLQETARRPEFDRYLISTHQTREDIAHRIRVQMAQENLLGRDVPVTEAEARAVYARESDPRNPKARYYTPETLHAEVISTATEATGREALRALTGGATFADVARRYSRDRSAANGGVIAPIARGRTALARAPGFEAALFALQPGRQFGPKQMGKLWWIFSCSEKTAASATPYAEVRTECVSLARMQKGTAARAVAMRRDFEDFTRKTGVQIFWDRYIPRPGAALLAAPREPSKISLAR